MTQNIYLDADGDIIDDPTEFTKQMIFHRYGTVDMANHPPHYKAENGMEVIDVIEAFTSRLSGIEATDTGNIIKFSPKINYKGELIFMIPDITFVESGWRRSLAIYRCCTKPSFPFGNSTSHQNQKEASRKFAAGPQEIKETCAMVSAIVKNVHMDDIYAIGDELEKYLKDSRAVLRVIGVLGSAGLVDLHKICAYKGDYAAIAGIGPEFGFTLSTIRSEYIKRNEEENKIVGLCLKVPMRTRRRLEHLAKKSDMTLSQYAENLINSAYFKN